MFINIFDSHTHSDNSADAHHSVTFMCEKAVEENVSGICVTDHCELREYREGKYEQRVAQSVFEVGKAKRIFKGHLAVMSGIELSDVLYDEALTDQVISKYNFDMVMVSQHSTLQGNDIYYSNFKEWSQAEISGYLNDYFGYLLRIAKWNRFDTMAHLTYPLRYITGIHKIPIDLRDYNDVIEEILKTVAQNGKAIEINTSGLWQALGDTMPPYNYVKRYRELGGEYITLGSDSHSADTIGRGIDSAMQMLIDAQFKYFTFYKERHPLQFKIL
ncbi:histidinol-phosphatase HisJ family protein [Oscillospiraceae bacterium PP1C4]